MRTNRLPVAVVVASQLIGTASVASAQSNYTLARMLGDQTQLLAANDNGTAIGFGIIWTRNGGMQPMIPDPEIAARFPMSNGTFRQMALNNGGTIAGTACVSADSCPFVLQAATWSSASGLSLLGTLVSDPFSFGTSINSHGDVVGWSGLNAGPGSTDAIPFIWRTGSGMTALSGFGRPQHIVGAAMDVNDAGMVVGRSSGLDADPAGEAFVWTAAGGAMALPSLSPGATQVAYAVNNRGQVAGTFAGGSEAPSAGVFFWSAATGIVNLNAPFDSVQGVDINDRGEIVATVIVGSGLREAWLFKRGLWSNLTELVPSGFEFHTARAITNDGWIVGAGSDTPAEEAGTGYVVMTPTVRVTANGQRGTLTLGSGQPLRVGVAFDAGEPGVVNPAELYIALITPSGVAWIGRNGITGVPTPLYQGPLPSFGPLTLIDLPNVAALPAGTYAWLMLADADTNGLVNGDFLDFVVTPIVR